MPITLQVLHALEARRTRLTACRVYSPAFQLACPASLAAHRCGDASGGRDRVALTPCCSRVGFDIRRRVLPGRAAASGGQRDCSRRRPVRYGLVVRPRLHRERLSGHRRRGRKQLPVRHRRSLEHQLASLQSSLSSTARSRRSRFSNVRHASAASHDGASDRRRRSFSSHASSASRASFSSRT